MAQLRGDRVAARYKKDGAEGYFVPPLHAALKRRVQQQRARSVRGGPPALTVRIDRRQPCRTLHEVLYTAGQAELSEVVLAVAPPVGEEVREVRGVRIYVPRYDGSPIPQPEIDVLINHQGVTIGVRRGPGALKLLGDSHAATRLPLHGPGCGKAGRGAAASCFPWAGLRQVLTRIKAGVKHRRVTVAAAGELASGVLIRALDACRRDVTGRRLFDEPVLSAVADD